MNSKLFVAIQAALCYNEAVAQSSSGEMMHHRMNLKEYEHLSPHDIAYENPHEVLHQNTHEVSHANIVPLAGYWELLDSMDHYQEFPFEMYIPLYYDSFKDTHGYDYADLIESTIY